MTYVFDVDAPPDRSFAELKGLLGGKAANLSVMARDLGLPVPPAFTISTAACNAYLVSGWPAGLDEEVRQQLATMERRVGRRFGDAADPLLVSVRSGAPVSMPGMMDTILDLGLNDATTRGLAAVSNDPAFAADCRARFETMFIEIVGVDAVPDDPWAQLRAAIEAVFRSWNGDRARAYRQREGIAEDLGTAVTIQAMVFGNRSEDSGSGVLFTRNPATGEAVAYGDVMFEAQGEDVVAGTHRTESLAELAVRLPSVASELERYATVLERHHADMCDIEFTIEQGKLWLLQCRVGKRSPQAALRIAVEMAEAADFPLTRAQAVERVAPILADPPSVSTGRTAGAVALATGLPASPGLIAGEIATTPDAAIAIADRGRSVILVRSETSPDDVHGMARAAGVLTSRGGLASHAAVVARGWGIPAVVGAAAVLVSDDAVSIGGRPLALGSPITIDGSTGEIFDGVVVGSVAIVPEAETLLGWARELGIPIGEVPVGAAETATASLAPPIAPGAATLDDPGTVTGDDLLATLAIKGYGTQAALAEAHFASADDVRSLLDRLVTDGQAEVAGGDSVRLTPDGKEAASGLFASERDRWGTDRAATALDAFLGLDERMKATVTAWQMRDVDGSPTLNDHADPTYDARVLEQLEALHGDALAWLRSIDAPVVRFTTYRARLDRAARLAAGGDGRYVASPRVDSYHSIWFELHEDLILLAGRTRADEVAAGRA
ncbi:MAG TPA: pyruvate, phosphate dikinase [Candidatus Limnocylindrales bacterium]